MHAAILAILAALCGQAPLPTVVDNVELVSVARIQDGATVLFFWARCSGEWTCVDHRWAADDMQVGWDDGNWSLSWRDDSDSCYRIVRSPLWAESVEAESPLAAMQQVPWFSRLLEPGLRQPRAAK